MSLGELWSFGGGEAREIAPRTWMVSSFANVAAFETEDGLLLVDTGPPQLAQAIHDALRRVTSAPLHTFVATHGHVDHAFGLGVWRAEGARPRVIAHRAVLDRYRRYARTAGYNRKINETQFGLARLEWPSEPAVPDVVYDDDLEIEVGGERFELRHALGETDDATWLWAPARKVVASGDFVIGCAPNAGNPQKVQRYAEEWADALDAMAALEANALVPGHGPPLTTAAEVAKVLRDGAAYLRAIVEQTIAGLNEGKRHEDIARAIRVPAPLASEPHLAPAYDRPEFIARNVIRRYGGWWDGFAASLLPAPAGDRARAIAALAGGIDAVVARARAVAASDLPLACHLAEWASLADPASPAANEAVRDLFRARAAAEPSLMARAIFARAAADAEARLAAPADPRG